MRTLIVEDQGMFRDILAKLCEVVLHFSEVKAVATIAEARVAMRATVYELMIVDIDLPDGDGF